MNLSSLEVAYFLVSLQMSLLSLPLITINDWMNIYNQRLITTRLLLLLDDLLTTTTIYYAWCFEEFVAYSLAFCLLFAFYYTLSYFTLLNWSCLFWMTFMSNWFCCPWLNSTLVLTWATLTMRKIYYPKYTYSFEWWLLLQHLLHVIEFWNFDLKSFLNHKVYRVFLSLSNEWMKLLHKVTENV
jgi:hypothetical protein